MMDKRKIRRALKLASYLEGDLGDELYPLIEAMAAELKRAQKDRDLLISALHVLRLHADIDDLETIDKAICLLVERK